MKWDTTYVLQNEYDEGIMIRAVQRGAAAEEPKDDIAPIHHHHGDPSPLTTDMGGLLSRLQQCGFRFDIQIIPNI